MICLMDGPFCYLNHILGGVIMKKSEFLDQLRLEVGLAYDYAKNRDDFIEKVVRAIYEYIKDDVDCSLFVYEMKNDCEMDVKVKLGNHFLIKDDEFGLGFLSIASIRSFVLLEHENKQVLLAPIYENNCLKYIFKLHIYNYYYPFSTEDVDFISEVVRFVEVRQQRFIKDDK